MAVKVGSFTKATGGAPASQAITGIGFQPKALILWTAGSTTVNTYQTDIRNSVGLTDGTTTGCVAASANSGGSSPVTARRTATAMVCLVDGDGTVEAEADLTSLDTDGFTLNWTTNDANATIINYMAIGGTGLSAKVLQWQLPTSTGGQAITGVGFRPAAMIGVVGLDTSLDTSTSSNAAANLIVTLTDGTTSWAQGWVQQSLGATSGLGGSAALRQMKSSPAYTGTLASLDADGWTYNFTTVDGAYYAYQLCLSSGSFASGVTTKSTDTDVPVSQTISGLGFTPEAVWLGLSHATTAQFGLCETFGAGDGTNERCAHISDHYNVNPEVARNYSGNAKALVQDYSEATTKSDTSTDSEADLSLASAEFTLTWTTNDNKASDLAYFALATGAAASGSVAPHAMHYKRMRTQ